MYILTLSGLLFLGDVLLSNTFFFFAVFLKYQEIYILFGHQYRNTLITSVVWQMEVVMYLRAMI